MVRQFRFLCKEKQLIPVGVDGVVTLEFAGVLKQILKLVLMVRRIVCAINHIVERKF